MRGFRGSGMVRLAQTLVRIPEGPAVDVDFFHVRVGRLADALAHRARVNDRIGYVVAASGARLKASVSFLRALGAPCVRVLRERFHGPRNHMIVRI